jgi:hypothetical protein
VRQVILALLVGVSSAAAAETGAVKAAAHGRFDSGGVAWDVTDAYAFRGKSSMGDESVIVVAITNGGFPREVIDGWWDRKQVLEQKFRGDGDTVLVYLEFSPTGEYQGLSYYVGSGNGCGYCSGGVASTVKLAGGRLVGGVKSSGKDRIFDVTLDLPVASDDHGPALPAGGGEPAKVYLAYHAALKAGDAAALKKTLDSFMLGQMAKGEKDNNVPGFLAWLGGQRYLDTVSVDKGFATARTAVLLVSGSGPIGKRQGQVTLTHEKDGWRFSDEVIGSASE